MIITIGRQFCSGGSEIGRKLSERLGIPYYDKNLYEHAAKNRGFSTKYVREIEETPTGSFLYSLAMFPYVDFGADNLIPSGIAIAADQTNYILEKAKEGPCIFVGRCADSVLSERSDVINVFIYSEEEGKYVLTEEAAEMLYEDYCITDATFEIMEDGTAVLRFVVEGEFEAEVVFSDIGTTSVEIPA